MKRAAWIELGMGLLLLGSCGQDGPGDTVLDITFNPCESLVVMPAADTTDAERAAVAEAIAMWNQVLPTRITLDDVPGAARLPIEFRPGPRSHYGVYEDEVGIILINRGLDGLPRSVTIAHELGHALGLFHVGGDHLSVMNAPNLATTPQPFDADALAALWGACDQ